MKNEKQKFRTKNKFVSSILPRSIPFTCIYWKKTYQPPRIKPIFSKNRYKRPHVLPVRKYVNQNHPVRQNFDKKPINKPISNFFHQCYLKYPNN
jgi:hypothetical protein